jgi:hypothetical protein
MARKGIVPIANLDRRAPEAGRIRLGVKTGRAMKSIDTFRFTSPYQDVIEDLAHIFGGEAKPWSDERARIRDQWEVITPATDIPVYLPQDGLSVKYEKWSGGGCERRCDGEICEVVQMQGDDAVPVDSPCICLAKGARECEPYTRLNVVLPMLRFAGTWRLETKGWNAAHELPGMVELIQSLHASGKMVQARLSLQKRSDKSGGRTRHYVVPVLSVDKSPEELQSGDADVQALPLAPPELNRDATALLSAEEDERLDLIEDISVQFGIDYALLRDSVFEISTELDRIQTMHNNVIAGAIQPVVEEGKVKWIKQ